MFRPMLVALAACLAAASAPATVSAQSAADSAAIRRAALDYVEGFYAGDTLRLKRAIRPEFYKYGFWRRGTGPYAGEQMTWDAMIGYARRVAEANRPVPAGAPRTIELLDVMDQTAAVKLTASWGYDYLLLGRFEGAWMISHVLWQGPLPGRQGGG